MKFSTVQCGIGARREAYGGVAAAESGAATVAGIVVGTGMSRSFDPDDGRLRTWDSRGPSDGRRRNLVTARESLRLDFTAWLLARLA